MPSVDDQDPAVTARDFRVGARVAWTESRGAGGNCPDTLAGTEAPA